MSARIAQFASCAFIAFYALGVPAALGWTISNPAPASQKDKDMTLICDGMGDDDQVGEPPESDLFIRISRGINTLDGYPVQSGCGLGYAGSWERIKVLSAAAI